MSAEITGAAMTFPQRVWYVLSRVDVSDRLKQKARFSYLPWADAWELLMQHYPESTYSFDEPRFFDNGTGEQWVTVTVKEGESEFSRRWWLPYLDSSNRPLTSPTALQINNTRMRALVKCIAMLGLGVYVYSGEDVPDKEHDSKTSTSAKSTSVRATVMEDMTLDEDQEATVEEWVIALRDAMPSESSIDHDALTKHYMEVRKLGDLQIAIAHKLTSWQRRELRSVASAYNERMRAAAVAKIEDQA